MTDRITRRDFLKFSSLLAPGYLLSTRPDRRSFSEDPDFPNILIVVYDALSADHMSLHGYLRQTTPNISRLSEKAIVYHNHYAAGHWTYPATASLLTGMHTWAHRGFDLDADLLPAYRQDNLFGFFSGYTTSVYTHNYYANRVLFNLTGEIDEFNSRKMLFARRSYLLDEVLEHDYEIASISKSLISNREETQTTSSLFLSHLTRWLDSLRLRQIYDRFVVPPQIPNTPEFFLLEDATDWIVKQAARLPRPYLSYYHLYPPHAPYAVRRDFADLFRDDGYQPVRKPRHFILEGGGADDALTDEKRLAYNQAVRYVDAEFGRLMEDLESSGQLENTWVILTSDHGEIFERGITGHVRTVFYQQLVKTPLLIFPPGQTERVDVHQPTSAVDLVPTLLHLAGKPIPGHLEGTVLPPFAAPAAGRSIFSLDARHNPPEEPLSIYTAMHLKWPYKLTKYTGYDVLPNGEPVYELYDLEADPEELANLIEIEPHTAARMQSVLEEQIILKDEPGE